MKLGIKFVIGVIVIASLTIGIVSLQSKARSDQTLDAPAGPSSGGTYIQGPSEYREKPLMEELPAGTSGTFIKQIMAYQFNPIDSSTTYSWNGSISHRYRTGGTSPWFDASVSLPSGALLTSIEAHVCDTGTSNIAIFLISCDGSSCSANGGNTTGTPGCIYFSVNIPDTTIDNFSKYYFVEVNLGATDSTTSFGTFNVYYRLQLSPAPGTPTFSDVPTTHLFYQAIEALAAAGITSGCGGGKYCPGDPITRGQMAAFLAGALGLYWAP